MAIRNRYSATHIPTICAYIAKFATQFSTRCCRYYFDWNTSAGDQQATFTKHNNNNNKLCKISFAILKLIPCQPVHMYHPYMSAIHINIVADFQSRFYFRSQYTHLVASTISCSNGKMFIGKILKARSSFACTYAEENSSANMKRKTCQSFHSLWRYFVVKFLK